jgi:putative ABC transport system ATP-binding protein
LGSERASDRGAATPGPPSDAVPAVACTGLVKIYWTATGEVHALKGIDAAFPAASLTAVVGPSGSGKSSLLRILAGMDRATAGSVRVAGRELAGLRWGQLQRMRARRVAFLFQRPSENLVPWLTVRAHLRAAAGLRWPPRRARFDDLLEELQLAHRRDAIPRELSGGEQQRAAFAQAVVRRPDVIVADEPTAELDSSTARGVIDVAHRLARRGIALVVATHDPMVMEAADRILFLRHGSLEAEGHEDGRLSVIDADGRIQIPPDALRMFPGRRAVVRVQDGSLRIDPP